MVAFRHEQKWCALCKQKLPSSSCGQSHSGLLPVDSLAATIVPHPFVIPPGQVNVFTLRNTTGCTVPKVCKLFSLLCLSQQLLNGSAPSPNIGLN